MAPQQYFAFNAGLMDIFPLRVDQGGLTAAQKWPALMLIVATATLLAFVVLIVWGIVKMRSETHTERYESRSVSMHGDSLAISPAWRSPTKPSYYSFFFSSRRSGEVPRAPTTRTPLLALHGKGLRYMQTPCTSLTAGEERVNADLEWDSFLMQE